MEFQAEDDDWRFVPGAFSLERVTSFEKTKKFYDFLSDVSDGL